MILDLNKLPELDLRSQLLCQQDDSQVLRGRLPLQEPAAEVPLQRAVPQITEERRINQLFCRLN